MLNRRFTTAAIALVTASRRCCPAPLRIALQLLVVTPSSTPASKNRTTIDAALKVRAHPGGDDRPGQDPHARADGDAERERQRRAVDQNRAKTVLPVRRVTVDDDREQRACSVGL